MRAETTRRLLLPAWAERIAHGVDAAALPGDRRLDAFVGVGTLRITPTEAAVPRLSPFSWRNQRAAGRFWRSASTNMGIRDPREELGLSLGRSNRCRSTRRCSTRGCGRERRRTCASLGGNRGLRQTRRL
jgi:hypothetical protein